LYFGFRVGEVSCPTRYEATSSSISFRRSLVYGLGVLGVTAQFKLSRLGLLRSPLFRSDGKRLASVSPARASRA
jgi:hypothetical protein